MMSLINYKYTLIVVLTLLCLAFPVSANLDCYISENIWTGQACDDGYKHVLNIGSGLSDHYTQHATISFHEPSGRILCCSDEYNLRVGVVPNFQWDVPTDAEPFDQEMALLLEVMQVQWLLDESNMLPPGMMDDILGLEYGNLVGGAGMGPLIQYMDGVQTSGIEVETIGMEYTSLGLGGSVGTVPSTVADSGGIPVEDVIGSEEIFTGNFDNGPPTGGVIADITGNTIGSSCGIFDWCGDGEQCNSDGECECAADRACSAGYRCSNNECVSDGNTYDSYGFGDTCNSHSECDHGYCVGAGFFSSGRCAECDLTDNGNRPGCGPGEDRSMFCTQTDLDFNQDGAGWCWECNTAPGANQIPCENDGYVCNNDIHRCQIYVAPPDPVGLEDDEEAQEVVECSNHNHCDPGEMCDSNNDCAPLPSGSCYKDTDCPTTGHCGPDNTCVECSDHDHCGSNEVCSGFDCVECARNSDCDVGGEVCRSNQCVVREPFLEEDSGVTAEDVFFISAGHYDLSGAYDSPDEGDYQMYLDSDAELDCEYSSSGCAPFYSCVLSLEGDDEPAGGTFVGDCGIYEKELCCKQCQSTEICNGRDDNCNGIIDDGMDAPRLVDGESVLCGRDTSVTDEVVYADFPCNRDHMCQTNGEYRCTNTGDDEWAWTPYTSVFTNNVDETLCDNIDNDCDGQIDEGCNKDGDAYCATGVEVTPEGEEQCPAGPYDCDDTNFLINPGMVEAGYGLCSDGIDNDCGGGMDSEAVMCNRYFFCENDAFSTTMDEFGCSADVENELLIPGSPANCGAPPQVSDFYDQCSGFFASACASLLHHQASLAYSACLSGVGNMEVITITQTVPSTDALYCSVPVTSITNSCEYTTQLADVGVNDYTLFACDVRVLEDDELRPLDGDSPPMADVRYSMIASTAAGDTGLVWACGRVAQGDFTVLAPGELANLEVPSDATPFFYNANLDGSYEFALDACNRDYVNCVDGQGVVLGWEPRADPLPDFTCFSYFNMCLSVTEGEYTGYRFGDSRLDSDAQGDEITESDVIEACSAAGYYGCEFVPNVREGTLGAPADDEMFIFSETEV